MNLIEERASKSLDEESLVLMAKLRHSITARLAASLED